MWFLIAINVVLWGGIIIVSYYTKNKNRMKSASASKYIENNSLEVLHLYSDKIKDFININKEANDETLNEALVYLKRIQDIMSDSNWAVNVQEAVFKATNITGDTIFSVRGTVDIFVEDALCYTMTAIRSNIKNNEMLEISQNIYKEASNAVGVFKAQFGSMFSRKMMPKLIGHFRDYEIQITEDTKISKNNYIRELAGASSIDEPISVTDELVNLASDLPDDIKYYALSVADDVKSLQTFAASNPSITYKINSFTEKYFPIAITAMNNYILSRDDNKQIELKHTLEVLSTASKNLYKSVTEAENESSSVEQTVMEQLLIRDGLYDPFTKSGDNR